MKALPPLLVALLGLATNAHGATKLCLYQGGPTIEVPESPRFVIERWKVSPSFAVRRGDGRSIPHSVEILDEYFARVTVHAGAGDVFRDPGFLGRGCNGRSFRVVPDWSAAQREIDPSIAAGDGSALTLSWVERDALAWTRLEWAYSVGDLERGLFGSKTVAAPWASLEVDPGFLRLAVRLVRSLPDGSEQRWDGWIERAETGPRIRRGTPPGSAQASSCPAPGAPRPVPVDPTFVDGTWGTPRFHAATPSGESLPLSLSSDGHSARVRVSAPEGTVFTLQRLPAIDGCDRPLVATRDRSRDEPPTPLSIETPWRYNANAKGWTLLSLQLAEGPWGWLELEWSPTPEGFGDADRRRRSSPDELALAPLPPLPEASTRVYVRITPRWDGATGAAWNGWIDRDPESGAFTLSSSEPIPGTAHREREPRPASPAVTTATEGSCARGCATRWDVLIGSLALGWLLAALALRRRSPGPQRCRALDDWSVPQLVAVAAILLAVAISPVFAAISGAGGAAAAVLARSRGSRAKQPDRG